MILLDFVAKKRMSAAAPPTAPPQRRDPVAPRHPVEFVVFVRRCGKRRLGTGFEEVGGGARRTSALSGAVVYEFSGCLLGASADAVFAEDFNHCQEKIGGAAKKSFDLFLAGVL
jgi:hypothetical protein